ncbi:Uncharacterised protein [Escherichia coli]|uniref:Uncharacterized protein n=1 Tax=Escherichia coli TaxID=562 RepID=A0A376Y406_ECOLX|nr:Uncharacterised protein [Escherichia coli]
MLQRQIAKLTRGAGVGFLVAVFDGKPTAHQQVKAHQLAVFGDRHEVHVVGVQIDIVLWRDHYRGFEFTRQVGLAEDRFFISSGDFSWSSQISAYARVRGSRCSEIFFAHSYASACSCDS